MADYVSREAVIETLCMGCQFVDKEKDKNNCWCMEKGRLNAIPAADVRPVMRAKWYWDNYKYDWCCSNCLHPADHRIDKNDVFKEPSFPFCPHCGADMRETNLDITKTKGDNHDY